MAGLIGWTVQENRGWSVSMESYNTEIFGVLSGSSLYWGISLKDDFNERNKHPTFVYLSRLQPCISQLLGIYFYFLLLIGLYHS